MYKQSWKSTPDHPFHPSIRFLGTQLTRNSRYMTMVAMTVLAPITKLPGTRQPSIRPNIILLHKLQETATKSNNLLEQNNNLLKQNNNILQNNITMMKNTFTQSQDILQTASNCKSILETMLNHFQKHPDKTKTSPTKKKDNPTTPPALETISVSELIPIKKRKKKKKKSTEKRTGKPVRTSMTKEELWMLQLVHNGHLSWKPNQKRSEQLKDRNRQQLLRVLLMNILRREQLKDQNRDPTPFVM